MDAKNGVTAIVDYEYTAKEPDELDLVKGAIIQNIKQMPGGWWEGTLKTNGKTGMFPDNFVRVIEAANLVPTTTNDDNNVTLREKSATKNRRCKVIYSYTQVNDDELSLAVGDVIEFLGEVEEGWWRGRLKTKIGVFPSNFVVDIEPSPVFASKRPTTSIGATSNSLASAATTTTTSSSLSSSTTAVATAPIAATASLTTNNSAAATTASALANAALAAVTTKKSNRLSFHSSKEDILSSNKVAPTSSVIAPTTATATATATTTSTTSNATSSIDDVAPNLPPKPQREYCRVEFPYAPQNDDELELKVGEVITIITTELPDKGWWKGELNGKVGVFPDNFVKMMTPPDVIPSGNEAPPTQSQHQQLHHQQQQQHLQTHSQKTAKIINSGMSSTTSSTTTTTNHSNSSTSNIIQSSQTTTAANTSKVFIKKSGSTSSTQSSNHKDSFGSYDSLNDILSETGLQSGNVAAQRKSLENKNFDITNAPESSMRMGLKKPQQEATTTTVTNTTTASNNSIGSGTSNELRKSLENMDEKSTTKTTPPPVLTKKPNVPTKKSTTVTSVAANLFTSLKTKVKSVENTLTTSASTDAADGIGSSKLSPTSSGLPETAPSGNVVMRRAATIAVEDTDFDRVERASILTDMRAGRVKAPKRRPPSAAINVIGESNNNNSVYLNGSSNNTSDSYEDAVKTTQSSDDNSTGEDQLAKPKPREWEKKKAPWMEELKASQVKKKTSPSVEPRGGDIKISNNSATTNSATTATTTSTSSSSNATTTKLQSSSISSTSSASTTLMQQSMIVESSTQQQQHQQQQQHHKKEQNTVAATTTTTLGGNNLESMSKSFNSKMTTSNIETAATSSAVDDLRASRPNSLSIHNRSVSPTKTSSHTSGGSSAGSSTARSALRKSVTSSASPGDGLGLSQTHSSSSTAAKSHTTHVHTTHTHVNNHHATGTTTTTAATSAHAHHQNGGDGRIGELERRIEKLESIVNTQQRTIDELVRTLREETARVKVLRGELDKYAQCVTQV